MWDRLFECYLWEANCVLDWSVIAAWAQAIFSVIAIVWAGRLSRQQSKDQYENSLKLFKLQREMAGKNTFKRILARFHTTIMISKELLQELKKSPVNSEKVSDLYKQFILAFRAQVNMFEKLNLEEMDGTLLEAGLDVERICLQLEIPFNVLSAYNLGDGASRETPSFLIDSLQTFIESQTNLVARLAVRIASAETNR